MNDDNLKKGKVTQFKSGESAARDAAYKSANVRRRKRSMKTAAKMVLDMKPTDAETVEMLKSYGLEDDEMTNTLAVVVAMVKKAQAGNVQAAAFLRDTLGESPGERSRREDNRLRSDMFEYKKECDSGENMEIEDLDAVERSIYEYEPVQEKIAK